MNKKMKLKAYNKKFNQWKKMSKKLQNIIKN